MSRANIVDPLTEEVVVCESEMITLAAAKKLEEMRSRRSRSAAR